MDTQLEFVDLKDQWRGKIIRCYYGIAVFCFGVEILCFLALILFHGTFKVPIWQYVLMYIVAPTLINFLLITLVKYLNEHLKTEKWKNIWILLGIMEICTIMATVHSYFLAIMGIFISPMIVSAVLDDMKLTKLSAILSCICLYISIGLSSLYDQTWPVETRLYNSVVGVSLIGAAYVLTVCVAKYAQTKTDMITRASEEKEQMLQALKIDNMTGLYNHSEFYQALGREVDRIKEGLDENTAGCSVVVIDVDLFKSVNDTYGHENGDLVLQKLAKILKEDCVGAGTAFRYGGEEFALLLPDYSEESAFKLVEQIRKEIYNVEFTFMLDHHISISAGIYQYQGENLHHQDIFAKADDAMYYAKKNGRNRCVRYSDFASTK